MCVLSANSIFFGEKRACSFLRNAKRWICCVGGWVGLTSQRCHPDWSRTAVVAGFIVGEGHHVLENKRALLWFPLQTCLSIPDIKTAFSDCINKIGKRDCLTQACSALTGWVWEGVDWELADWTAVGCHTKSSTTEIYWVLKGSCASFQHWQTLVREPWTCTSLVISSVSPDCKAQWKCTAESSRTWRHIYCPVSSLLLTQ